MSSHKTSATLVLDCVLRVMRPLARLLIRHGVSYPAFAQALKTEFLAAARQELQERDMPQTDSALSLLSGVHRRDVRTLSRPPAEARPAQAEEEEEPPLGLAAQVVARWLHEAEYLDEAGAPRALPRGGEAGGFDKLVAAVSQDVRPRAVLDELLRLGAVTQDADGRVELQADGFAPRQGLEEMGWLFSANLHDHAAAASLNLQGGHNFLEQSIFVDEITQDSAERLHKVAQQAWRQAFKTVMHEAQTRFDADARDATPEQRNQRARFGVYFYSQDQD
ncbi:hypothetical protein G8A07_03000 [Roseateles sp. DAIF2]|uniref:DUF6502 family protein n=1 Tax=Roseateles sp. DAIF2 TaxID=2714952 RepID=UPI0018A2A5F6|nr:DUF6502 family protein [Roseateles sp. DAIF2]QPF71997.1 hypothetical protein G8A07_03000 [Roseateles sp. DAIF2]